MLRTKLRNQFLKNPVEANRFSYTKQTLVIFKKRKEKKKYFANLNKKNIIDNKTFWQTISFFLRRKQNLGEKLFASKRKMFPDDTKVASGHNNIFSSIIKNLDIQKYEVADELHLNMNSHPNS